MALTQVSYSMIAGNCINAVDYGASTSNADNAAAIQAALNAAAAGVVRDVQLPGGILLFGTTIEVPEGVTLRGQGNTAAYAGGSEGEPTRLTKIASMTTTGVKLVGKRARLQNLGVYRIAGALGRGIWMANNYQSLEFVSSNGHAEEGIFIGSTPASGYLNCNCWSLYRVEASYNSGFGIVLDDGFLTYPVADCNAGCAINISVRENAGSGISVGNAWGNTFINILAEQNGLYGMILTNEADKSTVIAGDFDEGNLSGQLYNAGKYNCFIGQSGSGFTDAGSFSNILGYTSAVLNTSQIKNSATITASSFTGIERLLSVNGQSTNANGRGVGIYFGTPNGGDGVAAIDGGLIATTQSATPTTTNMTFYQATSGVLAEAYRMNNTFFIPMTDNDKSLGASGNRWSVVYAGTGTINTSDIREKQDIANLSEAERQTAVAIKGLIKSYRFKDAVAKKGNDARIHFGAMAQEVASAFVANGLDPEKYALFCYDKWDDEYEPELATRAKLNDKGEPELDKEKNPVMEQYETGNQILVKTAGDRFGLRYDELLAFVIAAI